MKNLYLSIVFLLFVPAFLKAQNNFTNSNGSRPGAACCYPAAQGAGQNNSVLYDGNGVLGLTYSNTACGLNYVQGSVLIEQRSVAFNFNTNGTGLPTSVNISGLPTNYIIDKAYLWFIASYYESNAPVTNVTIFNPILDSATFETTLIGQDGPKCWAATGEVGTAAYRADVSPIINGNGNYEINITGFTGTGNGSNEIDGTTLMIIYKDTTSVYQGSLIIQDGLMTSGTNNSYPPTLRSIITGLNVCGNSTYAEAFLIGSDMQESANAGKHVDSLNGSVAAYTNSFWNFDMAITAVNSGQSSAVISAHDAGDCYSIGAVGLYYQDTCMLCGPATSVNEINNETLDMSITPNPLTSSSLLQLSKFVNNAKVIIYDMVGKELQRIKFSGNKTELRKENLERGVYFITVDEADKRYIKKLIVQ